MIRFEEEFAKSAGKPIIYNGQTLLLLDYFPTKGATEFRLTFEACNSDWRQGVSLKVNANIEINERIIPGGILLWQDTAPRSVDFAVRPHVSTIDVKNVWDVGDGVVHSWHNGAAMITESIENGRRYHCNDGYPDDDCDDIIFRLERFGTY